MMDPDSSSKKPFASCVQGVSDEFLARLCYYDYYGEDLELQPEMEWIISMCVKRDSIKTRPFIENFLRLGPSDVSDAIRAASRSKEGQLRHGLFTWCKRNSSDATFERLLEALYIGDEVELVEGICKELSVIRNISDERKVDAQPVVAQQNPLQIAVPHKAVHEDEVTSPSAFLPDDDPFSKPVRVSSAGNFKPPLNRLPSDKDMMKPVSATEHGSNHAAMALSNMSQLLPNTRLLGDKGNVLHTSPTSRGSSSNSVQVEDATLHHSLTLQGDTASSNMLTLARLNELERKMEKMEIELRAEDAKLKQQIEKLEEKLKEKDSEIFRLKKELKVEVQQKQEAKEKLDIERQERERVEESNEELTRKLEELNKKLRAKDDEIESLEKEKRKRLSLDEEDDSSGVTEETDGEDNADKHDANSDEDTRWKFEEFNVLGYGNFGIVIKGLCRNTGRELAVKMVRDIDDKMVRSLEQEYQMLSKLRHKRIVSYIGVCNKPHPTHGNECLFIMTEFMPGGTLAHYYEKEGAMNETLTGRYTRQILEGAEYLHDRDIIHRDIKGSNIMRDTRGHVKLADFGSAKQIYSERSEEKRSSYLYGTAPWASPEVLRQEPAHFKSDVWSIAATVVEMMTAKHPYKSDPQIQRNQTIIYMVCKNELNPLQSAAMRKLVDEKAIQDDVITFLTACFKSAIEERPSATQLLRDYNFCCGSL